MFNPDYTKELGLPTDDKVVSLPIAITVLVIMAVGVGFLIATVTPGSAPKQEAAQAAPTQVASNK